MSHTARFHPSMRSYYPFPLWRAAAAQVAGFLAAIAVGAAWSALTGTTLTGWQWISVQSVGAAAMAAALGMQWWWIWLNAAFAPALALGMSASISPIWSAAALTALLLVYGGTQRTRVPLYLSSAEAVRVLRDLVPTGRPISFLDIGAGTGGVLAALCASHPHARLGGIERAPVPFLVAWLRSILLHGRYSVRWGDFWSVDLSRADVVYAYLSPAPMQALWEKATREMPPGALFVSFRFVVPGVVPSRMIPVGAHWMYVWEMP